MTKTIRWGMIGCGDVAERKSGPGFYKASNSALVAVMRRDGALAQDFAKRHGVARWHDDAEAIISALDIDAVYIATLPDTHHEYALRCAATGKAIYVEKPMALTHEQCLEMIAAACDNRAPLWVGYYRRALPRFLKVQELIQEGAVGTVRCVVSRQSARSIQPARENSEVPWRVDPARSGGGYFFEGACHTLDILDFFFGPVVEVRGFAANQSGVYRCEDFVACSYRFETGVYGNGVWSYASDHDHEMNEIIGTTGRIQFSTTTPVPIRRLRGDASEEIAVGDPPHVHQPLIQTIVDELNGSGHCPSTGESAARTAWVMDEILKPMRKV